MARIKISHLKNSKLLQDSFLREITDVELGTLAGGSYNLSSWSYQPAFRLRCPLPSSETQQSNPPETIELTAPDGSFTLRAVSSPLPTLS